MKRWKLAEPAPEEAYAALPELPRLLASLLWRRGIRTPEEAERFLNPDWERDVHDPYQFVDMKKAVARVMAAVRGGEKIVIHGDYDADGVSGSVVLHSTLTELKANVEVFLPHREKEGYGLSAATIEKLTADGCRLIITCDCGISNGPEIAIAARLGIDVIITDHHTLPAELPPAYAILHPLREGETYPFKHLTGGGVAFKLCQALWREAGLADGRDKWLLDMVAISTVADMGRLVGENRALVHYGLVVLNKTRRLGLGKLIASFSRGENEPLDAAAIGFRIAPRINAAGRMDHARGAFALLTAETIEEAERGAEILQQHNRDRQSATELIVAEARIKAAEQADESGLVVYGDGWPAALCGLVAARLVDDRGRPAMAFGRRLTDPPSSQEGVPAGRGRSTAYYVGSGRSIPGFDITAALQTQSAVIRKFGGHPMACGLTVDGDENFAAFKEGFQRHVRENLREADLTPTLAVEEEISLDQATLETVDRLRRLEPHGEDNPKPLFLLRGIRVVAAQAVGKEAKHLRLIVADDSGSMLKLIAFGFGRRLNEAVPGSRIDAVVELDVNEWNGRREPQGRVVDFRAL